jgi:hypothetical protein
LNHGQSCSVNSTAIPSLGTVVRMLESEGNSPTVG